MDVVSAQVDAAHGEVGYVKPEFLNAATYQVVPSLVAGDVAVQPRVDRGPSQRLVILDPLICSVSECLGYKCEWSSEAGE